MDIAIVGLGKMGGNMAQRFLKGGRRSLGWTVPRIRLASWQPGTG